MISRSRDLRDNSRADLDRQVGEVPKLAEARVVEIGAEILRRDHREDGAETVRAEALEVQVGDLIAGGVDGAADAAGNGLDEGIEGGAAEKTRTSKGFPPLAPQASASTTSATAA